MELGTRRGKHVQAEDEMVTMAMLTDNMNEQSKQLQQSINAVETAEYRTAASVSLLRQDMDRGEQRVSGLARDVSDSTHRLEEHEQRFEQR